MNAKSIFPFSDKEFFNHFVEGKCRITRARKSFHNLFPPYGAKQQ